MSGNKPEQEPSIEEILASIRQIISDDDGVKSDTVVVEQPVDDKFDVPVYDPNADAPKDNPSFKDVLDLTNEIGSREDKTFDMSRGDDFDIPLSEPMNVSDIDMMFDTPAPPPPPAPAIPSSQDDVDSLFSAPAASATTEAFSRLIGNIPVEREENPRMYADGRITLEDIAKDLLRPILRQWVDDHVPAMVERLVEKELEKLARQAR